MPCNSERLGFEAAVDANQRRLAADVRDQYDYVVVGAGAAGSVIAARLAADPAAQVLVLEAGGGDCGERVADPNRWPAALGSDLDWGFAAEPNPRLDGRAIPYSMGKVLGGGTSINVSTWSRGHKADWDHFAAAAGDEAWSYARVQALYRERVEDWAGPADPAFRGTGGAVRIQPAQPPFEFASAVLAAEEAAGLPRHPNANGAMMEAPGGCAPIDETVWNGRRQSIYRAYLHPRMDQPNVCVLTGATATQLLFQGLRVTGVAFTHQGAARAVTAGQVILSLGAIQTPKLLMQSGIGDEAGLAAAGVAPRHKLPGVGRDLHDHVAIGCVWTGTDARPPAAPRSQTAAFWKTRASLDAPNAYAYARPGAAITPENARHFPVPANCWSFMVGLSPASRGSVRLTGPDPDAPVAIDAGYLSDPADLDDLLEAVRFVREIGHSPELRPFTAGEAIPGPGSRGETIDFLRRGLGTFWHPCGTARMGADLLSVVDGSLRVHGLEGLRIADASIMPRVTRGNTMAPCVIIGERASDLVLQDA